MATRRLGWAGPAGWRRWGTKAEMCQVRREGCSACDPAASLMSVMGRKRKVGFGLSPLQRFAPARV